MNDIQSKVEQAVSDFRKMEATALNMNEQGFHLAFSGGKDSQCIYHLAKLAGVKFYPQFNITGNDPPELIRFIRENYPDVHFNRPPKLFLDIIRDKKMLPTMWRRFCCAMLKEPAGVGSVVVVGIRKQESARRAKREKVEHQCIKGEDKIKFAPIIDWSEIDVWKFLREIAQIPSCSLYDTQKRIGCVFCPMNGKKMKKSKEAYPSMYNELLRAIHYIRPFTKIVPNGILCNPDYSDDDVFDWWASNLPTNNWIALKKQTKLDI